MDGEFDPPPPPPGNLEASALRSWRFFVWIDADRQPGGNGLWSRRGNLKTAQS